MTEAIDPRDLKRIQQLEKELSKPLTRKSPPVNRTKKHQISFRVDEETRNDWVKILNVARKYTPMLTEPELFRIVLKGHIAFMIPECPELDSPSCPK